MPLALQSRLLRVIQEREIMRIGHDKVIPIDVRIIAASNRNLYEQVRKGEFREDLYYRLNVLDLTLPPLRERGGDIALLAQAFLDEFQIGQGNIRELRNFCERLSVLCGGIDLIDARALKRFLPGGALPAQSEEGMREELLPGREKICAALKAANGNKTAAAQMLGISRVTLWRQLKKMEQEN